jgi:hypothetical protein
MSVLMVAVVRVFGEIFSVSDKERCGITFSFKAQVISYVCSRNKEYRQSG